MGAKRKTKKKLALRLPGHIYLRDVTLHSARKTIARYHYSNTVPAAPINVYWIMARRQPLGVITLGVGSGATRGSVPHRLFGRPIHFRQWRTVERLVLYPQWNGGTVISQMFSLLFRLAALSGWRFIHTVADERAGNGAGYRASNFTPVRTWVSNTFGDLSSTKYSELGVIHKVAYQAQITHFERGAKPTALRTKAIHRLWKKTKEKRFEPMLKLVGGRLLSVRQYEYVRVIDPSLKLVV